MKKIELLAILLFLSSLTSCCSYKRVAHSEHISDTVTVRDTVFQVAADSALIRAKLKCDSIGNVYITELNEIAGRKIQTRIELKNNYIRIPIYVDSIQYRFKYFDRETRITKTVQVEKRDTKKLITILMLSCASVALFILLVRNK